jgi:hypothetical protein
MFRVMIEGVQYIPWNAVPKESSKWVLTDDIIAAAKRWPDWDECLKWARDNESNATELTLWRAQLPDVATVAEPKKKVEPLPVAKPKSKPLF